MTASTPSSHAESISLAGCTDGCSLTNAWVAPHPLAAHKTQITVTGTTKNVVTYGLKSGKLPSAWVPSPERFPRAQAAVAVAAPVRALAAGTPVLVGTTIYEPATTLNMDGYADLTAWAAQLALTPSIAVTNNGHAYTVVGVDLTNKRLTFATPIAVADGQWHSTFTAK